MKGAAMPRLRGTIEEGAGAFVQLRDEGGDFVGEVRADEEGHFALYAVPGHWTLICLTPGGRRQKRIEIGAEDIDIRLPA